MRSGRNSKAHHQTDEPEQPQTEGGSQFRNWSAFIVSNGVEIPIIAIKRFFPPIIQRGAHLTFRLINYLCR